MTPNYASIYLQFFTKTYHVERERERERERGFCKYIKLMFISRDMVKNSNDFVSVKCKLVLLLLN